MISRKVITVLIYILLVVLLFVFQPSMMFDQDGNIKVFDFETRDDTTLMPLILILPLLAIISYMIVLMIEMIMT